MGSTLKEKINADLKQAMLGGDRFVTETLRGLKSAILNQEIASNKREEGLSDSEVEQLIAKECKKRLESAELFEKGGNAEAADKEFREKEVLEAYLPKQLSDEELKAIVEQTVSELGDGVQMGMVIASVKGKVGNQADGARIAAIVKSVLDSK